MIRSFKVSINSIVNTFIAISFILLVLTELRIPGLPIGMGEILLLICCIALLSRKRSSDAMDMVSYRMMRQFWILMFIALFIGTVVNIFMIGYGIFFRTLIAYIFCCFVCITLAKFCTCKDIYDIVYKIVQIGIIFFFFLYLYGTYVDSSLFGMELFYGRIRFTGGAKNPNQTALFFSVIPFFSFYRFKEEFSKQKLLKAVWWGLLTITSVYLGCATKSEAIFGAWIIGLIFALYRLLFIKIKSLVNRICLVLFTVGIILLLFFQKIYDYIYIWLEGLDKDGSRQQLWVDGIIVFKDSFFLGLGPGSYSGPSNTWEAHNTLIDFAVQGGILAVICLLVLFYKSYKGIQYDIIISAGVIVLFAFTMAHFAGRQPIYYLYIIMFISMRSRHAEKMIGHKVIATVSVDDS